MLLAVGLGASAALVALEWPAGQIALVIAAVIVVVVPPVVWRDVYDRLESVKLGNFEVALARAARVEGAPNEPYRDRGNLRTFIHQSVARGAAWTEIAPEELGPDTARTVEKLARQGFIDSNEAVALQAFMGAPSGLEPPDATAAVARIARGVAQRILIRSVAAMFERHGIVPEAPGRSFSEIGYHFAVRLPNGSRFLVGAGVLYDNRADFEVRQATQLAEAVSRAAPGHVNGALQVLANGGTRAPQEDMTTPPDVEMCPIEKLPQWLAARTV